MKDAIFDDVGNKKYEATIEDWAAKRKSKAEVMTEIKKITADIKFLKEEFQTEHDIRTAHTISRENEIK